MTAAVSDMVNRRFRLFTRFWSSDTRRSGESESTSFIRAMPKVVRRSPLHDKGCGLITSESLVLVASVVAGKWTVGDERCISSQSSALEIGLILLPDRHHVTPRINDTPRKPALCPCHDPTFLERLVAQHVDEELVAVSHDTWGRHHRSLSGDSVFEATRQPQPRNGRCGTSPKCGKLCASQTSVLHVRTEDWITHGRLSAGTVSA